MLDDPRAPDKRPSPEALLDEARREGGARGRLKIFLGAAPGVGKTYEMLTAARAKQREGLDVVAAVVETHGRVETQALLDGLPVLPRRQIEHRTGKLDELDLDALLARRPALALIDELAHSNAPGSRHPKRYQDVEEVLDAGIDVYTTLNIQHVESLNDVVAQITRVRVRETVPDSVLDRADDIEIVDLSPDDLLQRLREGKVYVPRQAERALAHFFSRGNLTALRELALRRTAQRVDEQLVSHMQAHAIPGPWAAGEHVLVCINEDARSAGLVRYAKRLADRLKAPWTALVVENRRSARLTESQRDRIADALRLAHRLGAETETLPGSGEVADDIVAHARDTNVTHIVVGKSNRSRWFELVNGSVVHDLVRRSGNISVHVIAGDEPAAEAEPRRPETTPAAERRDARPFVVAALSVAAALGIALMAEPFVGVENVDLVLLCSVVTTAIGYGLYPSLLAVALSSLAYNFFFIPPTFTFSVADPRHVAALFFFALVAVLVSNVAARSRQDAVMARSRARATEALYGFSRKLASCGTLDDVLWATAYQIASMLRVRVVILLPGPDGLTVRTGYPPEDELDQADYGAAKWAFDNARAAGRGADTLPGARRLFLPMPTGRGLVGVVGLDNDRPGPILTPEQQRLLDSLIDQGALAIERVHLVEDLEGARLNEETDRLRQALLTSISHDLKTPLASVLGSAQVMRDLGDRLDAPGRAELLGTVIEEAERLNRFIANLLDMTKLESGAVVPNIQNHDLRDLVGVTLRRAAKVMQEHRLDLRIAQDLPPVRADAVLFEQVLFNVLDNAAKYAEAGTAIRVEALRDGDGARIDVVDEGPGIPAGAEETIFEKFYRAQKGDHVRPGTGLGLPIARGLIEAIGGGISAASRTDRPGAIFTLRLAGAQAAADDMERLA
ncbi:sensor histidine kinase KdpD [uncultured Alsobacter sp.]|uniref:sensor histidine kinase n=1 Tax=uncultured Alsobacter sp. TaxID=1748258 RepID=UPI0025DFF9BB|nr:sensor histidine kinase KdpD [uncultured Alsobacter sp.]